MVSSYFYYYFSYSTPLAGNNNVLMCFFYACLVYVCRFFSVFILQMKKTILN